MILMRERTMTLTKMSNDVTSVQKEAANKDEKRKSNYVTLALKETADKDDAKNENKTENHDVTNLNDDKKLGNNNEESESIDVTTDQTETDNKVVKLKETVN